MEIKRMAERLNSVPVRKKVRQLLALTLAVLMVNPVTGYGVAAHAQETETITAFAKLSSEIASQQLAVGAKDSGIQLPDALNVTIGVSSASTAESTVKDSQAEEIPTEEVKPDESTPEEPAKVESPADDSTVSGNDAAEQQDEANGAEDTTATDSNATAVVDSGKVPLAVSTGPAISTDADQTDTKQPDTEQITSQERTLTGITWKINAERSGSDTFNSANAGAVFFYEPVLPEGYTLADGVSLPQIKVQIEDSGKWAFSQSQTIDGVEITVKAEKEVFPEGAVLHAEKVTSKEDKEKIQSAVSEEVKSEDKAKAVTELVSFDITITDADGKELQPDTGKGEVRVSFAQLPMVTEDTAPTQELKVFHMDDTLSEAKGLDTTVDQEAGTLEAPAEHFTVYTAALLTATAEDGEASVTDSSNAVTYYDTIEEAITAAQGMSGSTVKLLKDVATENAVNISSGTLTLDLNGKHWNNTYSAGSGVLQLQGSSGNIASLTVKDIAGGGSITTVQQGRYSIFGYTDYSLTLVGGNYTGIWSYANNIGDLLAEGYVYRNSSDGTLVTNTSGNKISNVTVTPAPVKITTQPEDAVEQPNYTTAPTLSVTAETVPADSGKKITYQWYKGDGTLIDGATNASYTVDSGLAEGAYAYYCAVICDGYTVNTDNATFYVSSSGSTGNYEVTASNGIIKKYPTLETAITAAKSKPGSTVKLLADATTASKVEVTSGTFTIDLNGKTWTSNASDTALHLAYGSHVTLKDSATGGKFTSAGNYTIFVEDAPVTIENGNYENTYTGYSQFALLANGSGFADSDKPLITIKGGTFTTKDNNYAAYFMSINVSISGGTFSMANVGSVYFAGSCPNVSLTGGTYNGIQRNSGNVGTLLASGYGYKTVSGETWVNDTSGTSLSNVTVQPVPAKITAQPQNAVNATYGYTSAPSMSVTAEKTAAAPLGSTITYQWYCVKSGSETSDTALGTTSTQTLPTGLDAGSYSFYCVVTCDGYILNSQSATFIVEPKDISASTLALDIPEGGYTYDKTAKTPAVTLTLDGHTLALGTDYILDYMDNTDAGIASVTITGQGNYTGIKSSEFTIAKATPNITLEIKGAGENGEIIYGGAVTYTVHVTGVNGEALTDAAIVGISYVKADGAIYLTGSTTSYDSEKGAYIVSTTDFNNAVPGTRQFCANAVFREGSDTCKNYILNENGGIESERVSKTVQKSDTSIAFDSSYTGNCYYTGSPITNPVEADLSITGAGYSNVVFTWYDQTSAKLDTPPTLPGSYILAVSIPENDYYKLSSNTKSVTISSYDGAVTFAYNGSTTKAAWYSADVAITADGYTVSDSIDGTYAESYLLSGEGAVSKTLYFKQDGTGYITDGKTISVNIDKIAPAFSGETDGIAISNNSWKQFLNNITFGKFFTDTKDGSISATDSGSGVAKYYYYIDTSGSTTVKTADELNALSFTEGNSFSITDENKYVIYAYAVDVAGNKSVYICTDGIVIDKTAPTVTLTAPAGSDLGDVSGVAKAQMNETGTITYVIKNTEQSGITAQDILAATDKKTVSVTDGQANTNLDVAFSGLTANTTYYLYAVGTDSAENNGIVVNTSFTTTTTQPTFSGSPTITGTYGQQVKDMTVSQVASTNGVAGSWSVSSTDQPSVGTSATYDAVFTPDDAGHYATVTVSVTPTITRKSLTAAGVKIETLSGCVTYDGTAQVQTVPITDSLATIEAYDYEYSYSNNINAGTATITITGKRNYTGSVNRTFTIKKAPAPTITYPAASGITYGQKLSASSLTGGSTEYGSFAWVNGNTVPTVGNSGYEVTFTPNAGTVANYEAITNTTKTVAVTVSKAVPAVTVNADVSGNTGNRKATLTAAITGAGDGETPTGTVKFVNSTSGSDEDIAGATAVTITGGKATYTWTGLASQIYKVKAVYSGSGNYNTATSSELSFDTSKQNQAALNIGSIGTKTYGDGAFTLSATGGSVSGAASFTSSDPSIVSISGTTATIHKAGTVTITATKAANSTYNEVSASVSLTVGKKTLTVKANDQLNIIKGAAMPVLTYTATGLVGSDTFTSPTVSTTAVDTNTVGEYDIIINGGTLANADSYTVSYESGKLTVVNAVYTVTVTNGTGGGNYSEVQTVTITADSRSGYTFTGWSSSDGVTFASNTASTTTFIMPAKAVTVTANYSKNSGGSSGGGSSSGGSSTTTPAPTPEKTPNQPVTATASVTATAGTNGAASASIPDKAVTDVIAKAQSDATSQGKTANGISVELNVTMPKGATSLTAALTRSSLDSLVSAGVSSLEINGSLVQVSFDKKALAEIQKQSTDNISIAIAPKANLSDAAKKIIATRPVYDITVGYGSGKSVSSFGAGIATVSIPYTLGKKEAVGGLYAVYVDAKGNAARIAGSAYDANSGCVIFTTTHFSQYGIGYTAPTAKFTDISTHWAKESIDYVVGRGLLSGTSDTAFSPNSAMTRGMLVTALGRLAGVDTKAYTTNSFTDVKSDSAYRPYIEWAYSKGIIQGIGNSQFASNRAVTREEIAVIFANYAKATGYTLPITREATTYADASSIGSAYKDAVKAMQQAGIMMGGNNNKFNPGSSSTRAEVASMLTRYIKLTIDPATAQGWAKNDSGQWMYFKDGKALTGWQTIDGKVYCFDSSGGAFASGWRQNEKGEWFFLSSSGSAITGWKDIGANGSNKTYYFTKAGLMVSGKWLEIDGKWYYFYTDGSLARNTKIDGYEVDKNGVRKTK